MNPSHLLRLVLFVGTVALSASSAHAAGPVFSFGGRPEELKIKVKKPEAERLFEMANLRPEYKLELRESFLPQVLEAVESKPF
jgi:hypothetical protein